MFAPRHRAFAALLAFGLCEFQIRADEPLSLLREDHWLIIRGPQFPGGELRVNYLEAYCRADSTNADWTQHTVIPHQSEQLNGDGRTLKLRDTLADGLIVDHTISAGTDEIDFRLVAQNPGTNRSDAHWAQACPRLGPFAGMAKDSSDLEDYL